MFDEPCQIPPVASEAAPDYEAIETVLELAEPCVTTVCVDEDAVKGTPASDCCEELRKETLSGTHGRGVTGDKWDGSASVPHSHHDPWRDKFRVDLEMPRSGVTNGSRPPPWPPPCVNIERMR